MRGIRRRWLVRETPSPPPRLPGLDLPPLVERVLLARGFGDGESIRRFCDPKLTHLHDPSLLPGADAAAERLVDAVRRDRTIAIYGDYDVDGITATAILFHLIRAVAPEARLRTYVPHRLEEGYGLNTEALTQLRSAGVDLVVTVDCGISAAGPVAAARAAGLDVIVTDHHNLPGEAAGADADADAAGAGGLPDAVLVHPRLPGSGYPFGDLCGAGVAFKLAWRFATCWCNSSRVSEQLQRRLLDLLPLVALGTIADVVPLVGENRILTAYGLRLIRQTPVPGLQALIEASDLMGEHIDCEKVGFVLAPRLNACGRMGHAAEAVELLTTAAGAEAEAIAQRLCRQNRERQRTERDIAEQAMRMAEDAGMTGDDHRAIVLADPAWHPGVVGIVCSRLVERYGRPTVLLERRDGVCRGSARSIDGYSIYEGLCACAEHLASFGGHHAAAGLALDASRLDAFTAALVGHANTHVTVEQLTPTLTIDCDAQLGELDQQAVGRLASLSPFGRSNPSPVVRLRGLTVAEPPRPIGGQGRHLQLRLRQDEGGRRRMIRAVWWSGGSLADRLAAGMPVDVVIEPKLNAWKGRTSVEGVVRDVMIHGSTASA